MNWDAIGATGELIGAVLLLGSLIYVGLQIRDAKLQIRSAAAQARSDAFIGLWKVRMTPELVAAELKARSDPDAITVEERHYLVQFITMFLNHYQNNYYQLKVGALDADQVGALESLPVLAKTPYYRKLWREDLEKGSYNEEFIEYVDSIVNRLEEGAS